MWKISAIVLVGLLFIGEKQATNCGQGFFSPILPHGIKLVIFNGSYWVLDALGFGLITSSPNSDQRMDREYMPNGLVIYKILEYGFHDDVYFRVKTSDEEIDYIAVVTDSPTRNDLVYLDKNTMLEGLDGKNYKWYSLYGKECFYGSYYFFRIILLVLSFISLVYVFKPKRQKK